MGVEIIEAYEPIIVLEWTHGNMVYVITEDNFSLTLEFIN
jgi:hypothetical protein